MAVLQMERINVCAMKRDRKKLLEHLQRCEAVEIIDAAQTDDVFTKADTSTTHSLLLKNAATAADALDLLKKYSADKEPGLGFLRGRNAVSVKESDDFAKKREKVLRAAQQVVQLERDIAEGKAEILRVQAQLEALTPWLGLPCPQIFTGTKKTSAFIGSLEGEVSLEEFLEKLALASPELEPFHVEVVGRNTSITTFLAIAPKRIAAGAEDALRLIGFTRPASASSKLPKVKQQQLLEREQKAQKQVEEAEEKIATFSDKRADIKFLHDHMKIRAEKYAAIENLAQSKHVFVLDGYVAVQKSETLKAELHEKFTCDVDILPLAQDEEAPVLLANNAFVEPMEPVLESYSLPGKNEIDPSPAMSIFYYALFGMMFSDFGYGLIMAGVCGFCLLKFKNMDANWRKNIKLFFGCGIATMFWGVVFSSYFGDVVDAVARTFFGRAADAATLMPPLWFIPLKEPMRLLMFCLLLGIIHLTAGYVMKIINCVKQGQYLDIVYDAVFPTLLLFPLLVVLMGTEMFEGMANFKLSLPPIVNTICLAIAGVCMVGILLTGGRESKNWFKRLLKGAYALYNALAGWLSDILSYSRLLALGLATGVIGSVVNQLGGMFGAGIVGVIGFVVVFCFGHALNFGINVLGAYVHSNRLEYVEFFGKFYEGGGRKFSPFGIHTKYYKIEEETQNG